MHGDFIRSIVSLPNGNIISCSLDHYVRFYCIHHLTHTLYIHLTSSFDYLTRHLSAWCGRQSWHLVGRWVTLAPALLPLPQCIWMEDRTSYQVHLIVTSMHGILVLSTTPQLCTESLHLSLCILSRSLTLWLLPPLVPATQTLVLLISGLGLVQNHPLLNM